MQQCAITNLFQNITYISTLNYILLITYILCDHLDTINMWQ